jgi:bacterioferritin (cytochrome b1)
MTIARPISDDERWLLSFYRTSEITGALFFGRLAKTLPAGPIQRDLTQHFADESSHASYWTQAIYELGFKPERIKVAYQDSYLEAAGLPVNIMEILAITQVFERRVIQSYARHSRMENLHPIVAKTLARIMGDERWHIEWVSKALTSLELQFGKGNITKTLRRYTDADQIVYKNMLQEERERFANLVGGEIDLSDDMLFEKSSSRYEVEEA